MSGLMEREGLMALGHAIAARWERGEDCPDLIDAFRQGVPCSGPGIVEVLETLRPEYDGNYSVEFVVERALLYRWPKPKLTREELIELVERLQTEGGSEAETAEWLETLEANVPDPNISDLIYWSEEKLPAEEVVGRALAYAVVALPPPGEAPLR